MVDPKHFEANAEIYAGARPPYPPELWGELRAHGILSPGSRALDLGAGTGQATGPLLAAGLTVTALEPGPTLAAALSRAHPEATVVIARAEETEFTPHAFDLVVAATSIHWMDLDVVLPKIHDALAPSGVLAVWRNVFGDPEARTPFREQVASIVRQRASPARPGPDPEDASALESRLTGSGLFTTRAVQTFRWSMELDDEQVRRLFTTFSDWTADEAERAAGAVRELGGRTVEHYQSWLVILDRV